MSGVISSMSIYERRKVSLNLALLFCSATTLFGVVCLVGYASTRAEGFASAGLVIFSILLPLAGVVSLGLIAISIYLGSKSSPEDDSLQLRSFLTILSLIVMPVAAAVCFGLGTSYASLYELIVVNNSAETITNINVFGAGVNEQVASLSAGSTAELLFDFELEGQIEIKFDNFNSDTHHEVVDEYAIGGIGGHTEVVIDKDFSIHIKR